MDRGLAVPKARGLLGVEDSCDWNCDECGNADDDADAVAGVVAAFSFGALLL